MISMLQPLIAGNAIRIFIEPISGAKYWRVLKKASDNFSGHDDPSAVLVYEGDEKIVVDAQVASTPNGTLLFYRAYYWNGTAWVSSASRSATPAATYEEHTTDTMSIVRERLEAFLLVEVERGNFLTDLGYIQVYTAPPSLDQNVRFPVVTITLENESPAERGIGENISGDDQSANFNMERVERLAFDDEMAYLNADQITSSDESQQMVWVTECYIRCDFDGDGISELRKVVRAGNQILENEIVDCRLSASRPFQCRTSFLACRWLILR